LLVRHVAYFIQKKGRKPHMKHLKTVLIYPRTVDTPVTPLGILYLAAVLESAGVKVTIIDTDIDDPPENIARQALALNPDFVGITATTAQILLAVDIAAMIKKLNVSMLVVVGGPHPTVCPEEVIDHECIDIVAIGEGEKIIENIARMVSGEIRREDVKGICYKDNEGIRYTTPESLIEDLDDLPFPARHLLNSRFYYAPPRMRGVWTKATGSIMASRGCPYKCIWCSSHTVFGYKVRYRSADNIIAEIIHMKDAYAIDSLYFYDDTFTLNKKLVIEFCCKLLKLNWKGFKWGCQARVDTVDEEVLSIMKKAGCVQLDFGVESGSPNILKTLRKDADIDKVKRAFALCHKVKINSFASFMIGIPGETYADILLTQKLIKEIKPDYCEFFYATPYPGTEFYDIALKENALDLTISYNRWMPSKQTDAPVVEFAIKKEELIRYRSMLHNSVIVRNYLSFLKSPSFLLGAIKIVWIGFSGVKKGFSRFIKTGKVDNIFVEILAEYRRKLKLRAQLPLEVK
jgi:anaerobic magnesium-protoporphyrin IX monomethyl ester cyclase